MNLEKSINRYPNVDSAVRDLVGDDSCKGILYNSIDSCFDVDYGDIRVLGATFNANSDVEIDKICVDDPEYFIFQYGEVTVSLDRVEKAEGFVDEYVNPVVVNSYVSLSNISSFRNLLKDNKSLIFLCVKREVVNKLLEDQGISNIIKSKSFYIYLENSMDVDVMFRALFSINFNNPIENKLAYSKCWSLLSLTLQNLNLKKFKRNISYKTVVLAIKIQIIVLKNITAKISVEDIAYHLDVDPTFARRSFESVFNETIHQYYSRKRLELAARMVLAEELSITDIAFKLGYAHLGHFSSKFKTKFGALPKDFSKKFERCNTIMFSDNCVDRYCSKFAEMDWLYDSRSCEKYRES